MSCYGNKDVRSKANLAVYVFIKGNANVLNAVALQDSLNHKLLHDSRGLGPKPILVCKEHKRTYQNVSYYVELSNPVFRERLLALSGTQFRFCGTSVWPVIRPWVSDRSIHQRSNSTNHQNHHQERFQSSHTNVGNSGRKNIDNESNFRPSKRPRVPSLLPASPRSDPPHRRNSESTETSTTSKANPTRNTYTSQLSDCTLFLINNPPSWNPGSFREYLNLYLNEKKKEGVFDDNDDGDGKSDRYFRIQDCYERTTANTSDGWVLETRTAKIADWILNNMSGKVILTGTKLYFRRSSDTMSPSPPAKETNGKHHSPSSPTKSAMPFTNPTWQDLECLVFVSKIPKKMNLSGFSDFVNSFIRKTGIFERDVVLDSRVQKTKIKLLCCSVEAAKLIVDELNDFHLDEVKLLIRRHLHYQGPDQEKVPCRTIRQVSQISVATSEPSPSMSPRNSSEESVSDTVSPSKPASTDTEIAKLKTTNENLTKQIMKHLKENKALKMENKKLAEEVADAADAAAKESINKEENAKNYDEMRAKYETASTKLETLTSEKTKVDEELVSMKSNCEELKRDAEKAEKKVSDDYEQRLHDIHESWKEQSIQIQDFQEKIESLKAGQEKEAAEKEKLKAEKEKLKEEHQKLQTRYQEMTDALTRTTAVIEEERAVRKQMTLSLVQFKKAKKRAEKKLKLYMRGEVKGEEDYDA